MFGRGSNPPDQKVPGAPSLTPPTSPASRDFTPSSSGAPMMSPARQVSVIGPDLAIFGQQITLVCKTALLIAGEVTGDIHGDDITVGETGKVTGSVSARNLTVHGAVNGQLRGETVALHNTARISGDIVQKNLIIAEGAQFDGRVRSARDASDWQPELNLDTHRNAAG
ncbi:Polymer-forming cytoskeletal protein [Hyphomicrobium sp. 1Nfss2.1]